MRPEDLWAHTPATEDGEPDFLVNHLKWVAERAAAFGGTFGAGDICRALGLAHDLGKANPKFQEYLSKANQGIQSGKVPHSDRGAAAVASELGPFFMSVQGHHAGIPSEGKAKERIKAADRGAVQSARCLAERVGLVAVEVPEGCGALEFEQLNRMAFSALVDADFLATEEHYDRDAPRGDYPDIAHYRKRLEDHMSGFPEDGRPINRVRRDVQAACRLMAGKDRGFFRLTVPTGGGKTLASVLFALHHAETHGLDRVIVAIPYTSIIEQTAEIYRGIFGHENVLEHHSQVAIKDEARNKQEEADREGQDRAEIRNRLAAENWDCPLVVTTNVQLFESLLSNRPSKCRKLHNIARAVVILDEAQTLPPDLLQPATSVLDWMVANAGTSVVFCTATQMDYGSIEKVPASVRDATEIAPDPDDLFHNLKRVCFSCGGALTHEQVAERIAKESQILTIVNSRPDSKKVFESLADEDALYLSSWLYPAHRKRLVQEVEERLEAGRPCRLISTQVVEAGIDIDFPIVLRSLAPLDSIVQAAGRCNREGRSLPGPRPLRNIRAPR